jgi:hypothetical protein
METFVWSFYFILEKKGLRTTPLIAHEWFLRLTDWRFGGFTLRYNTLFVSNESRARRN